MCMAAIGTGVVDVSSVEKELNDKYANNPNIRINDFNNCKRSLILYNIHNVDYRM